MAGSYQNDIDVLPNLELYRYENLFKVYERGDKNFFYYNILKKIKLPDDINEDIFDFIQYSADGLPLTTLSYRIYGTTYLWWLIMIVNGIKNPVKIESKKIRYVKKAFLKSVLQSIKDQLK